MAILRCSKCENDTGSAAIYQNKKYGNGKRVCNKISSSKATSTQYRCTVCENVIGG